MIIVASFVFREDLNMPKVEKKSSLQYIRTCMQAKEAPHLTLVNTSTVKEMFDKEISTISAVISHKSCNPPLPLPPKRRAPTVQLLSPLVLI